MPAWALALAFWLHMAATIVWIGGLFFQSVVLTPALLRRLPAEDLAGVLAALRRRFDPLAWFSLAVLIATGLVQMSANAQYTGFLSIANRWAGAILAKHLAVGLMIVVAAYQTWFLHPGLERAALLSARSDDPALQGTVLLARQARIVRLNLLLGLVVLALTAVARTA